MFGSVFYNIAALLILASLTGALGVAFRQPLIVSFIAVGILAGPSGLGIIVSSADIELLAELGVTVLLFLVGLKLDLHLINALGRVALIAGVGQMLFTAGIGYGVCLLLGMTPLESLYLAVALTFSSTIIIVKLLSDKREIDSLHGRIALGILIVQDLAVVLAMAALSAFSVSAATGAPYVDILRVIGSGIVLIGLVGLFIRYVADALLHRIAQSPELMICFAISWAACMAALADGLGFSKELGGLLAGVSIASTPYKDAIATRMTSLRDFLLLFFFVALGARLELDVIGGQAVPALVLSVFVLVGKPLIVIGIMGWMGYRKRTGFLTGVALAQISEFSLVFMAMAQTLGFMSGDAMGLMTLIGLVTIGLSTYLILYSHALYTRCENALHLFERSLPYREETGLPLAHGQDYDVILFGLGRYGGSIHRRLSEGGLSILGLDFDPDVVRNWRARGHAAVYGDISDPEFIASLPLGETRWVIAAVPPFATGVTHQDPRLALLDTLRRLHYRGWIAVVGHEPEDVERLHHHGADLVLRPFADAADQAADLILGRQREEPRHAGEA